MRKRSVKKVLWMLALAAFVLLLSGVFAEEATLPEAEEPEITAEETLIADEIVDVTEETVAIKLFTVDDSDDIYYGDVVTLRAMVNNIEGPYKVVWEKNTVEQGWVAIFEGEALNLIVDRATAETEYRAKVFF